MPWDCHGHLRKGWLKGILGKEITEKQKTAFEKGKKTDSKNTEFSSSQNTSSKGMSFDLTEILTLTKNLSVTEFKDTPLAKYGYLNVQPNICVLCGISLKSVTREDFRTDIQLVSVCDDCLNRLGKRTVSHDATIEELKTEKRVARLQGRTIIPVHNLTFDDMRLCPIQPKS